MSPASTRGPQPGKVPPHIQERIVKKRTKADERVRRGPWYLRPPFLLGLAAFALLLGVLIGRSTVSDPLVGAVATVRDELVPLANESGSIWTLTTADTPSVEDALSQLENGGDPTALNAGYADWLTHYDDVLTRMQAVTVLARASGVKRLFLLSTRLSRDALETAGAAATVAEDQRPLLLTEARRVRSRAELADSEARALLAALEDAVVGDEQPEVPGMEVPLPTLPGPAPASPVGTDGIDASPGATVPSETAPATGPPVTEPAGDTTEPEPSPTSS